VSYIEITEVVIPVLLTSGHMSWPCGR